MAEPNIQLTLEGFTRAHLDSELLSAATAAMKAVPSVGDARVVVAADINDAIRSRLPSEHGAAFDAQRVTGAVGAKTLFLDGSVCIIIDGRLLIPGAASGAGVDVVRLFAHEAWHVVVWNHGEDFNSAFLRINLAGAAARVIGQALILIEEYRVERALAERGMALATSYEQSTPDVFRELRSAMRDAITLRYPNEPIDRTCDRALRAFNALTIHFAYLAADHTASTGARAIGAIAESSDWRRFVGASWISLLRALEPIPSAVQRFSATDLEASAKALAELLRVWLTDIGFDLYDLPGGELYFDVLRHDF